MSSLQLPREVEIAIAILVLIAETEGGKSKTAVLGEAIGTTTGHTAQVVHTLGKAGLLETVRGRTGGLRLSRPSARIRLSEIIEAMDPAIFREARRHQTTPVSTVLNEVSRIAATELSNLFASYTVWDLVQARTLPAGKGIAYLDQMCARLDCPNARAIANLRTQSPS